MEIKSSHGLVIPKSSSSEKTDFYLIPPKYLSYLISQNPNPLHAKKKKKNHNLYLYGKEDEEVGGAVGEKRQGFEA